MTTGTVSVTGTLASASIAGRSVSAPTASIAGRDFSAPMTSSVGRGFSAPTRSIVGRGFSAPAAGAAWVCADAADAVRMVKHENAASA
jgi:hypothetical protein